MCQISRQSDNAFAFYSSFCKCAKRGRKIRRKKKTKKLSQFLKSHISGMPEAISLKFGIWSTEVGGNVHSKICLVSSRQHRATEVRKLRFLSSCQYTHGVARRLLGPHDTLPCVLILIAYTLCICKSFTPRDQRSRLILYVAQLARLQLGTDYIDVDSKINCGDRLILT